MVRTLARLHIVFAHPTPRQAVIIPTTAARLTADALEGAMAFKPPARPHPVYAVPAAEEVTPYGQHPVDRQVTRGSTGERERPWGCRVCFSDRPYARLTDLRAHIIGAHGAQLVAEFKDPAAKLLTYDNNRAEYPWGCLLCTWLGFAEAERARRHIYDAHVEALHALRRTAAYLAETGWPGATEESDPEQIAQALATERRALRQMLRDAGYETARGEALTGPLRRLLNDRGGR